MRVAIIGKGKMGTLLAQTAQAKGMQVVGLFDITDKEILLSQTVDLVIDFSHRDNLDWVIDYVQKTHAALVYGTTGLNDEDKEKLKAASKQNAVFYSANYSIGIAVLTKVIKEITPLLEADFDMEIIEKHHNQKRCSKWDCLTAFRGNRSTKCLYTSVWSRWDGRCPSKRNWYSCGSWRNFSR